MKGIRGQFNYVHVSIFLLKVLGWCIPGISGGPTWTPPPFITCGTVHLFFDFFFHLFFVVAQSFMSSYQSSHLILAWRIIISSAPLGRMHRSARPAAQHRAVPRGAVPCPCVPAPCPCPAVRCGTERCCAMLYFSYMPSIVRSCCCCCCSHINSHNQVRGHRTGSSHSGVEEYPREKTQTKSGTRTYHSFRNSCLRQKNIKK